MVARYNFPAPGWDQHPEEYGRNLASHVRWGDVITIGQPAAPLGPVVTHVARQFAEFSLKLPAMCGIVLSCVDVGGHAIQPADLVTWTLLVGVGSATRKKFRQSIPDPKTGATDHDIFLQIPIEHLTVQASLAVQSDATLSRTFELSAQIAPFTSYEGLVRI